MDFFVWVYKLLGIQHSALDRRFFAIRFAHIADGYGDLSVRAHRVETAIKAIEIRDKTRKKVPLNTYLLLCLLNKELEVDTSWTQSAAIIQSRGGLLGAIFFCLRTSELLQLSPDDVKSKDEPAGSLLFILTPPSKTDQEKPGAARTLRATSSILRHLGSLRRFISWIRIANRLPTMRPHPSFRPKLVYAAKWGESPDGVATASANTHSLRDGGETALFPAGIDC